MPRPDEGLIHAWLDGQLPPDEAARIEELAATDPEWAAAVAEARGLVAASSRILSALDRVPAGVVPRGTATRTTHLPWWTKIAAAVVVVAGGSVFVMQNAPIGRMAVQSTEQDAAQPTPDTSKVVVRAPVTSPPVPATATSRARARVPVIAPAAEVPAGAGSGRGDAPALRGEALAASPVTPGIAPAPSVNAIVAERKDVQDAQRVVAELSTAKSLAAKAAPRAIQRVAPRAAPQAQHAPTHDLAQAQNAVPAQRVAGGVIATRSAQDQQETLCYRLVPDSSRTGVSVIMRAVRSDGDTLRLVPVESNVTQRAWIVRRDDIWRGSAVPVPAGRDTIPVVASRVACPMP